MRIIYKYCFFKRYHEPANLILNHLLNSGLFHMLCYEENNKKVLHEKILVILSHLFNRVLIFDHEKVSKIRIENTYNSMIILQDMPDHFIESIEDYNESVNDLFIKNVKDQNKLENDYCNFKLPLSNYDFSYEKEFQIHESSVESLIFDRLSNEANIVSQFAALSGLHDNHSSFNIKDKSLLIHLKPNLLDLKGLLKKFVN
jgi:hypothetical protein